MKDEREIYQAISECLEKRRLALNINDNCPSVQILFQYIFEKC